MPYSDPEKQRAYQREWMARRRAEFFADKSCVQCGSTKDMELDHIDPKLKVTHKIWSWSKARRDAEIAKCQVLCGECHAAKNLVDLANYLGFELHQHGKHSTYLTGCKCGPCRAGHAEMARGTRARKAARDNSLDAAGAAQ